MNLNDGMEPDKPLTLSQALGKRLKELCEERHLSYYQLSLDSGVSKSAILKIIHAKGYHPGIYLIHNICVALHIRLQDFFTPPYFPTDFEYTEAPDVNKHN